MIFVNFKSYEEASGERGLALAKTIEEVALQTQIKIIPTVKISDLKIISQNIKVETWIQNITESDNLTEIMENGARGTFLNHSDYKISDFSLLERLVVKVKAAGLKCLVFCDGIEELKKNATLKPDYISYEPPELIGSTTISVATARPEIIAEASVITKELGLPLIVGAGIKSSADIKKSLELGAVGFAVAKAIIQAPSQKEALLELVKGFE
jgi:triosephosphate isomerase